MCVCRLYMTAMCFILIVSMRQGMLNSALWDLFIWFTVRQLLCNSSIIIISCNIYTQILQGVYLLRSRVIVREQCSVEKVVYTKILNRQQYRLLRIFELDLTRYATLHSITLIEIILKEASTNFPILSKRLFQNEPVTSYWQRVLNLAHYITDI